MRTRELLALWATFALTGCSAGTSPGFFNPSAEELTWPVPPEQPRIRYLGQVASDKDIGKRSGFFDGLKQGLLGTESEALVTKRPFDVHVDSRGHIYVSGGTVGAILMLMPEQQDAQILAPEGPGALIKPMGLAGDKQDLLYIADASAARVVVLDPFMGFVRAYGARDVFLNPVDVDVSPEGDRVYVVDSQMHQLLIFSREGELIRRVGKDEGDIAAKQTRMADAAHRLSSADGSDEEDASADAAVHGSEPSDMVENRGAGPGQFRWPAFVDVAADGTVYVSDGMNFRVQAFDADGNYLREFGRQGDVAGAFARPKGVTVDSEAHVYVVDAAFSNVQIFDHEGHLLLAFAEFGPGAGQLWMPSGITIDDQDRIYVADRYNDRVQVFQYMPDPGPELHVDADQSGLMAETDDRLPAGSE